MKSIDQFIVQHRANLQPTQKVTQKPLLEPNRHKMPMSVAQVLGVAARITLYMVGQNGPTSFVFKDRLNNKYKVSIGNTIQCSCHPSRRDHCLHSIYVMIRIFNIPLDNPLIWQASYLDSELSDIIAGKYSQIRRRVPALQDFTFDEPMSPQFSDVQLDVQKNAERLPMGEQNPCPICQQEMNGEMLLTYCKVKCGNNFHLNCVKIWVEHKVTTQAAVTCPMCRCNWGKRVLEQLSFEEAEWKNSQRKAELSTKAMEFGCKGCGIDKIPGTIYKCLLCEDYSLCVACFSANKHVKHPFILGEKGQWRGAPQRREKQKKLAQYIHKRRQEQNYTEQLISKIQKINQQPTKLYDYLASAYPYVSKYISDNLDPNKKLDFDPSNTKCMICGSSRMIMLRRLTCGHFIDHNCLKECIVKGRFYCEVDGSQFLKGYQSLVKRKQKMQEELNEKPELMMPRTRYSSVNHASQQEMYNFNMYGNQLGIQEQPRLNDLLGNVRQVVRQSPAGSDRLRRRIDSNLIYNPISQSDQQSSTRDIRIRNVSNNTRRPGQNSTQYQNTRQHPTPPIPRPPTNQNRNTRNASLNRRQPPVSQPGLTVQGIVARRLGH